MKFNKNLLAQMRDATRLLQTSGPAAATEAIQRTLQQAPAPEKGPAADATNPSATNPSEEVEAAMKGIRDSDLPDEFAEQLRSGGAA